jgi:hypothetical protein
MAKRKFKKRRPYERDENPHARFRKMTRDHADVLQNIEFALVTAWRKNGAIDDRTAALALKAAISGNPPTDSLAAALADDLALARTLRADASDAIWNAGLKVVLESVHTHSDAQAGDDDYLGFASAFIV